MLQMLKANNRKIHEWAPFVVYGLPTVQLPKELHAGNSSWLCRDPKYALKLYEGGAQIDIFPTFCLHVAMVYKS